MVVQALGLARSTAEPRWSGIILFLFNPFIHSSLLHPLSSSPPSSLFILFFFLSLLLYRPEFCLWSCLCIVYSLLVDFFPCVFFTCFLCWKSWRDHLSCTIFCRSHNSVQNFSVIMASEYDIDNGRYDGTLDMLVWLASWTFLDFGSRGLTRDFSSFHC